MGERCYNHHVMAENQVELVKQKADIVSVIDSRVKLIKSGRNLKANCPFHGEKTPSFFVSPELQSFKCFGCGEGGDVFTFLQRYEGMDFPEALEYMARKVGVELKRDLRNNDEQRRKRLLEILHLAEEYYHFLLTEHVVGKRALQYLKDRGISPAIIKTFKLGYSIDSWQGLIDYLVKKKRYTQEELEKVGMVIRSGGGRYYDRFRGRVMFPLKDFQGKTVGFSGRVMPGEDVDEKEAKYINSPETELYHKSQMLYGISEVRSVIRKKNRVVVVEGEFDMIGSYRAGVREVVAIKGSALTQEQVELIRRLTPNVILALDADSAGSEATKRGITIADKMGMNLSVVEMTEGKDPDDLAGKNPELWKMLVQKPISVYDFLISQAFTKADPKTGAGKKAISRELAPVLAKINNSVEREYYLGLAAEKLSVTKQAMQEEVVKAETLGKTDESNTKSEPTKLSRRVATERFVIGCFLQLPSDLSSKIAKVDGSLLSDGGLYDLWQKIVEIITNKPAIRVRELVSMLPMENQRLVQELFVPEVVMAGTEPEKVEELFEQGLKALGKLGYKQLLHEVSMKMSELGDDIEVVKKLQEEYTKLTHKLKELEA